MTYKFDKSCEENVTQLIIKPPEKFIKSPRYKSIHRKRTREEWYRVKSSHKSLGLPRVPLRPPSDYLKKGSRIAPEPPQTKHVHYRPPDYIRQLPDWRSALPKTADASMKDFHKRNVEHVKKLVPKKPDPTIVVTRKGDRQRLVPSGLHPIYVYKKNFGVVPEAFKQNKSKQRQELEENALNQSKCRYITEDERTKLLNEMKFKWSEVMKLYQRLPFLVDTMAKIKRKVALEDKLKQLEKDIHLIEDHPYIYVYDDK